MTREALRGRDGSLAAIIFSVLVVGGVGGTGCALPCSSSDDCAMDMYCADEGICAKECTAAGDCGANRRCLRGQCTLGFIPLAEWISPPEGADLGDEPFDVTIEVSYRAESVELELSRLNSRPGERCAPLIPYRRTLEGSTSEDLTQLVTFPGLIPLGEEFGLEVVVEANGAPNAISRNFRGTAPEGLGGSFILTPREGLVAADDSMIVEVTADVDPPAAGVVGWVEPVGKPPTPRQTLGSGSVSTVTADLPLARGAQIVWLETESGSTRLRCGVGVSSRASQNPRPIEIGLVWDSLDANGRVDLQLLAEREQTDPATCRASDSDAEGVCLVGERNDIGVRGHGEQMVLLEQEPGIYGIAVMPSSSASAVRAAVRVSNGEIHLGWLGPRTVQADLGHVWLAGRLVVLEGGIRLEPVDRMEPGLPALPASSW